SKDIELEEAKNRHDVEINLYRQKSKYIMVESEKNISAQYANVLLTLEKAKEIHQKEQLMLIQQKKGIRRKVKQPIH
ncbi:hypothetical protein, partial [Staphylococcus aureus]|uniref:hypothetical protein n=1 Tax=Staphylococcus aureus TaxID=1280 RepID=UPI0038B3C283